MTDLLRELDHRANSDVSVSLLWRERDDRLIVAVVDTRLGEPFEVEVLERENPLDVFHHPFAYAALRKGGPGLHEEVASCTP